jgi:ornithine cyclodeaminase/alanine dehydrogenase
LPTIQGVIVLCQGENGYPLALMDSIEITIKRTGAATAVAAKYLARPDSKVATICGCGDQARVQLEALTKVCPLERALVFDLDENRARQLADELGGELKPEIVPVRHLAEAVRQSDICVTCTPSQRHFLNKDAVRPGTFIAAVGADGPDMQELEPSLMVSNKVVVDVLEQCAAIGDLHHALEAGLVERADVHAELGQVVAGQNAGRTTEEEITIFDSTGMALQDVAAAAVVYEKARSAGRGVRLDFSSQQ